jgi:hypothetical protein
MTLKREKNNFKAISLFYFTMILRMDNKKKIMNSS